MGKLEGKYIWNFSQICLGLDKISAKNTAEFFSRNKVLNFLDLKNLSMEFQRDLQSELVLKVTNLKNIKEHIGRESYQILSLDENSFLILKRDIFNKYLIITPDNEILNKSQKQLEEIIISNGSLINDPTSFIKDLSGRSLKGIKKFEQEQRSCEVFSVVPNSIVNNKFSLIPIVSYLIVYLGYYLLWISTSWIILDSCLKGKIQLATIEIFSLLLFLILPVKLLTIWLQGICAVSTGTFFKRKVMSSLLKLPKDQIKQKGLGSLLTETIEIDGLESVAISGGLQVITALIEVIVGVLILMTSTLNLPYIFVLMVWFTISLLNFRQMLKQKVLCSLGPKVKVTDNLIENLIGHKTRLLLGIHDEFHIKDDSDLKSYYKQTKKMDKQSIKFIIYSYRLWPIISIIPLLYTLSFGNMELSQLAYTLGGILVIFFSMQTLSFGLWSLCDAWCSWLITKGLILQKTNATDETLSALLDRLKSINIQNISFSYANRNIFKNFTLQVKSGEHLYITGHSGSGKSTLASLIAGLHLPSYGVVLYNGLDSHSIGHLNLRKEICLIPTEQENHIFHGPLLFNLLMGRHWPPTEYDIQKAHSVCSEIGLGSLIKKMPQGIMQQVGDGGWRLSSGERQRVYLARGILQKSSFLILDESFSALDHRTTTNCLNTLFNENRTMIIIGHP